MIWDCHFNLLEPIWMPKIVAWSFFVFITLPRNEKQAPHTRFRARVHTDWAPIFFGCLFVLFITFIFINLPRNASFK